MKTAEGFLVGCPNCQTDALYRYGRIWSGRQRYICLLCGRQFTLGSNRKEWKNKPTCPVCGKQMHYYQQGNGFVRFRCSGYPDCKQYVKVKILVASDEAGFFEKKKQTRN
ncbi:MAG: IS1 family transposase [Deltaproteobacteria bacterium]|nr:IS1 family transposase [Deltaproteobacteria bacterium]